MPARRPFLPVALAVTAAVATLAAPWGAAAGADDPERGQLLYENHCTACHESVVHVRERHKVRTPVELRTWVERWRAELGLPWTGDEVDDVTAFLGARHYEFPGSQ